MSSLPVSRVIFAKPFLVLMWVAVAFVVARAAVTGLAMHENFADMGNDDIMRLLLVRDWLAGQGWYDVAQYRLLPPEGVSFHWSRYIDVGIAAIILPLSLFFEMDTAEQLAVSIWPTLIMIISLLVIGFGTRRIFGTNAACFAVMCAVIWPVTGDLHSGAGNLDHHNIQMLMMTLMAFAAVWPSRPLLAGIIGGLAGAFSLAIGLESLPFIVAVGLVVLLRALFIRTPLVRQLLVAFCVALGLGSVLLWLGQTPPEDWLHPACDQLGTPTLSMIGIAAVASILPMVFWRRLAGPVPYLVATVLLTVAGVALAWPLFSICLDGPYGQLPLELQEFIDTRITEAKPGLAYAQSRPQAFLIFVLPVFAAFLFGLQYWFANRRTPDRGGFANQALGMLLALCLVGIAMIFFQMRTVIIAASVVPIIGGFVIAHHLEIYIKERALGQGLLVLFLAVAIISPPLIATSVRPFLPKTSMSALGKAGECRSYGSLIALNEVPPVLILNHISFGPSLLWATHHSSVSAGFHRSADALGNSIIPFQLDEAEMAAYVQASGATHLLLCRGYTYDGAFATELAAGADTNWLRRVPLSNEDQLLFEIVP